MKLSVLARKWHKWLALIIGVQLLFWTFSGLFMSAVPIEIIKSEHLAKDLPQQVLRSNYKYFPVDKALVNMEGKGSVVGLELKNFLDAPAYVIRFSDGSENLIDALSGETLSPLSEKKVLKIAKRHFKGDSSKAKAELISDKVSEYRGMYPVWKINFNNLESTTFYISPQTGKLTARRGALWRIYDFLWMLHIMDYRNRTDFNNWLLIAAALLGFAVSVSGLILIRYSFRKRDFKLLKGRK